MSISKQAPIPQRNARTSSMATNLRVAEYCSEYCWTTKIPCDYCMKTSIGCLSCHLCARCKTQLKTPNHCKRMSSFQLFVIGVYVIRATKPSNFFLKPSYAEFKDFIRLLEDGPSSWLYFSFFDSSSASLSLPILSSPNWRIWSPT